MSKINSVPEFLAAVKATDPLPARASVFVRFNPYDYPGFCHLVLRAGTASFESKKHRCSLEAIKSGVAGYTVLGKRKLRPELENSAEVDAPVEKLLVPELEALGIEVEYQAHKCGEDREAAKLEEMGPERYAAEQAARAKRRKKAEDQGP